MKKYHFIGIGGVGMSAVAQAFLDRGCKVSGSDRLLANDNTETLQCLASQGVILFPQDASGVDSETETVIYSTAIESDNPDLMKARELNIRICHRSEILAELAHGHELVAVAGTCGKSSVTAMLGHLLVETGRDPWIINGAELVGFDDNHTRIGSVRSGKSPNGLMVVEADESDGSLLNLSPNHCIVTNASADHFALEKAVELFNEFTAKTTGFVVSGLDDSDESDLMEKSEGWISSFTWQGFTWQLPMPGLHNIANAKMALQMAHNLGVAWRDLVPAMASFRGIRRRLERMGFCNEALVVDDYAHNPEKLSAALTTLQALSPNGVCALWRPHGYAPLSKMLEALANMFNNTLRGNDMLLLLPVYDAGGTANRSVNSNDLSAKLTVNSRFLSTVNDAEEVMRKFAGKGKTLVVFGARDPELPRLAKRLTEKI